ncbi:TylF/MycF/NovP-related O-methyltransferase [Zavarzinia sp.]|uniref:TylF/MycF/NovP-related O-methyltransferase n=1 Tax=Zavarzinia sp. TaxID=2027920 RepID=UPI003BB64925
MTASARLLDRLLRLRLRLRSRFGPEGTLLRAIRAANITYVGIPKLRRIAEMACLVRATATPGAWLEAGVALGGSATLIGRLKDPATPLTLYDVFDTIPPPGEKDGGDAHERYAEIASGQSKGLGGDTYYGYRGDLRDTVIANLARFGIDPERDRIRLVKGLFEDTLWPEGPIAFAHIDCDWYDPVRLCMDRIWPRLSPGGVIIFDDYRSYSGCHRAVDEFVAATPGVEIMFKESSVCLRKPFRKEPQK